MGKLTAASPCADLLPLHVAGWEVAELDAGPITSVTLFAGVSQGALEQALGFAFPAPLQATGGGAARCVWAGQGEALLMGVPPDPGLGAVAALVDQSDMWAVVTLSGARGDAVLARLVPVDMRPSAFAVGSTVRTHLGHMNASITRVEDDVFIIAVFRSMARTLVHDLATALAAVAARR